jgi:cation transport ATPase
VVRELRAAGIEKVVMLTGDNQQVAELIGAEVGFIYSETQSM